jgi:hypothetical protein
VFIPGDPRHFNSNTVRSQNVVIVINAGKNGKPFKVDEWTLTVFLDLKEVTEQTAVNCTVDMSGEKL